MVFDLDGVLIDSNRLKREAYFEALAASGVPPQVIDEVIDASPEGDRFSIIEEVIRRRDRAPATPGTIAIYVARYGKAADEQAATCPEMPYATAALAELSRRYPLYLNSATPLDSLRMIVERRGWLPFFRSVLGRPATKLENLARIVEEMGEPADSVVFVGDQRGDASAADACGCSFVGIENGQGSLRGTHVKVLRDLPALVTLLHGRPHDV